MIPGWTWAQADNKIVSIQSDGGPRRMSAYTVRNFSLCATLFFVFVFVFGIAPAHAIPMQRLQASVIIPVASGCGLGMHRGQFERCYPIYYAGYDRGYRNPYYAGPVNRGVCGGLGTHLACNIYGICWVACN
jgi:hypothetical protein